ESSFPRGRIVNGFVNGAGEARSYAEIQETGFNHGFGRYKSTRQVVEWMQAYNRDSSHPIKIQFFGFDSPTEMTMADSPRSLLHFVLDYFAAIDADGASVRRSRTNELLGPDS